MPFSSEPSADAARDRSERFDPVAPVIPRLAFIAALGAIACTVCDHLHVLHDVLSYAHPAFWDQAWWVPPLFFGASIVAVLAVAPLRALGGLSEPAPTGRQLAGDGIGFVAAYAFTAFGHRQPTVVLAVLVAFWAVRLLHGRAAWVALYSLALALGGTLFEAALSSTGAFHYHHADLLGVPRWLPGIYLHAALLAAPAERIVRSRAR